MEQATEFEKNIKAGKVQLVIGMLCLLSAISTFVYTFIDYQKLIKNPISLKEAKEGDYAYIDVEIMTDYFATEDSTAIQHRSYFVGDENYMYIADIDSDNRTKLNAIYDYSFDESEDAVAPDVVRLTGIAKSIPDNLKKIAIDSYNEWYGEEIVTSSNFKDAFGSVYLNTFETAFSMYGVAAMMAGVPFLIAAAVLFGIYFKRKLTTKKSIEKLGEKWDKVLEEVKSSETIYYKKAKLYLTKSYMISYQNGVEIFDYNDIVWVYPHEYRYNGSVSQKSIFVVTKDSKARKLATVSATKKNLVLFDEMYNTFTNKMPDVLSGFTKENQKKAKEMYQK